MPLSINDVITATTAAEVQQEILDLCATGNLKVTAWQPGSVVRTMIAIISEVIARKSTMEVEIARGGFGDLASPLWAQLWAQQTYDVDFIPESAATGYVTLTNSSDPPQPYVLEPGDLIIAHAVTGKRYRNQDAVTIAASGDTENVAVAADEAGTDSDAAPDEITVVVAPGMPGVTVTNPEAVLGADEETTSALVARTRAKLASLSPNGPKDAYDFVARTQLDKFPAVNGSLLTSTSTPITRTRTAADPLTGAVSVYLATASGAPSPTDVLLVQAGIDRWAEPWCVLATALAAEEVLVPVTYRVFLRTTMTVAQVQATIAVALARYFSTVEVGGVRFADETGMDFGRLYVEEVDYVIHDAVAGVERVVVTDPPTNIISEPWQVPVLGTITGTVTVLR